MTFVTRVGFFFKNRSLKRCDARFVSGLSSLTIGYFKRGAPEAKRNIIGYRYGQ